MSDIEDAYRDASQGKGRREKKIGVEGKGWRMSNYCTACIIVKIISHYVLLRPTTIHNTSGYISETISIIPLH